MGGEAQALRSTGVGRGHLLEVPRAPQETSGSVGRWARGQMDTVVICMHAPVSGKGFSAERLMQKLKEALEVGVGVSLLRAGWSFVQARDAGPRTGGLQAEGLA